MNVSTLEENERDPIDRMAEDYLGRIRRGEAPTIGEYVARHPERAEEIRDLFSVLRLVEGLKPDSGVNDDAASDSMRGGAWVVSS